ncbi:MAG: transcription antitermination factor NusB [Parcubacteria group bacterium CG11_big_fil_rev_8_21_14_0_20_39_22]|nr:MAG: transcription antitermination factor NusB [Parcubacteria group bacterium CG11_big_fil_rev_8_21_14_0_20_39_22]
MANRHLARSIVLQTLFEWDFNDSIGRKLDNVEQILLRNIGEFASGVGDVAFLKKLLSGIFEKRSSLDEIIVKAAPEWPLERISTVDRNVLRIGLFELLFSDKGEVPAKVAINEAIELAKTYGGEKSGKFVNGVLGSVYKEMGEPGKEEGAARKKREPKNEVPFEKMPIKKLGGAVVYAKQGKDVYLALVHDIFGHWTLSKGKLKEDEDVKDGTVREIKEEMGLDIEIKEDLGSNEYVASDPEQGKIRKQVHYFLAEAQFVDLKLGPSGGLDDAQWFKLSDILELNFYGDILPIVTKAVNIILKK